jgi:16S rRNA (guanine(966)-N(2))-methyltransferase RsmD
VPDLRITGGELRGRRLYVPKTGIRPTTGRVREALFSMLGSIEGARVLDLFCGSGALGIEALSRGALEATFVDKRTAAVMRTPQRRPTANRRRGRKTRAGDRRSHAAGAQIAGDQGT